MFVVLANLGEMSKLRRRSHLFDKAILIARVSQGPRLSRLGR
jgi:hypothetical protein